VQSCAECATLTSLHLAATTQIDASYASNLRKCMVGPSGKLCFGQHYSPREQPLKLCFILFGEVGDFGWTYSVHSLHLSFDLFAL
jgi:hypothetical protein